MSVDVNQLLPQNSGSCSSSGPTRQTPSAIVVELHDQQNAEQTGNNSVPVTGSGASSTDASNTPAAVAPSSGGGGGGGGSGRKRKRHSGSNNRSSQNFNNKRQKNKQQNIIICGGGAGKLSLPGSVPIGNANNSLSASTAPNNNNNNNNNNCSKSNAENYGGRNNKNFYHKIHFRQLNGGGGGGGNGGGGGRSRRLQLFPALSKFFLPDKRPRKEIIVPPTKFLLGGNISDPLNLNSLQDDDVEAAPKHSAMMTPPKVEVIIPPNIRDPLHLLDPVDSIEYEKQLTSPMKKMMGSGGGASGGGGGGKKNNRNHNKKKNRLNRPPLNFQKGDGGSVGGQETVEGSGQETVEGESADKEGEVGLLRDTLKLELLSVDVDLPERKRRISESTSSVTGGGGGGGKAKIRRMDSIVSPVIPQPGAHKRHLPMGPQGAPHRNRSRTHSVQSTDTEDLPVKVEVEEAAAAAAEVKEESDAANKSTDSIKSGASTVAAGSGASEAGGGADAVKVEPADKSAEDGEQASTSKGEDTTTGVAAAAEAKKGSKVTSKAEKRKNKNTVFQFGNYDRYYGYRNLNEMMDVRLQVFQRNEFLFKDKDVLDIGCNIGQLTTAVAKSLCPRSVLGIDIDSKLIRRAKQNVSLFVRVPPTSTQVSGALQEAEAGTSSAAAEPERGTTGTNRKRKRGKGSVDTNKKFAEFFPQSFPLCYGLIPDVRSSVAATTTSATTVASAAASAGASSTTPTATGQLLVATGPKSTDDLDQQQQPQSKRQEENVGVEKQPPFPGNIRFITANYVLMSEHQLANDERHKYDLIMCLSVTKWVQLNYGDNGLKMMFRRIFNQLRPGGKFILEAQNWASYKKRKKLTERIHRNFQQIKFYPSHFHEYLLSPEVGFSHSYPLGVPRHLSKGFRRPIQLYVKGDYTPSQVMWSDAHHPPQTPYTPYRGIYAEMMCPPPRGYNANSSVWGGGDNTPFRPMASTSQYYNPLETDSYLPSYETEVSNRRYCFQSPLYSSEWSPPPLSSSNSETRTPPKGPSTWSVSTTPRTPTNAMQGGGSVTNTPHHRHVYPPDEPLLDDQENTDSVDQPPTTQGVSSSGDTPRTEEDSPEH